MHIHSFCRLLLLHINNDEKENNIIQIAMG